MGIPDTEGWMRLNSFTDVEMLSSWFEHSMINSAIGTQRRSLWRRTVAERGRFALGVSGLVESRLPLGSAQETAVHRHAEGLDRRRSV